MTTEPLDGQGEAQAQGADDVQLEAAALNGAADLTVDTDSDAPADVQTPDADSETPDPLEALLSDDSLRARLFEHPSVAEKLKERENAGANRREAQLKRDAGKKDVTVQNVRRFFAEVGVEGDEGKFGYLYDLAQGNAAYELADGLGRALVSDYNAPSEVVNDAVALREQGKFDEYISTLWKGSVDAEVARLRADDEKKVTAEVNKRVAAEIKARGIEKAPVREGALTSPRGAASGGGITLAELDAMPTEVFRAKSSEEQARLITEARQNALRLAGAAR